MMFSKRNLPLSCALSSAFSSRSRCCSSAGRAARATSCDELERLDQEVDGAALDRGDCFGDAAEPGHDDRPDLRVAIECFVEDCHAVGIRQPQVDNEAVVGKRAQPLDGIRGIGGLCGRKAVGFQAGNDGLTEVEVVFDDKDGRQGSLAHKFAYVKLSSDRRWPDIPDGTSEGKASELVNDC